LNPSERKPVMKILPICLELPNLYHPPWWKNTNHMCWNMAQPVSLGGARHRQAERVSIAWTIIARCDQNLSMCDKLYSDHYEHDFHNHRFII
jgi:hypothetical protein